MILEEGLSTIEIPDIELGKGPGIRSPGFYNTQQILNRDLTVMIVQALRPKTYLDGFGGSGIRGIRISLETGTETVISDINKRSAEIIRENVHRNKVNSEVVNEPFESIVSRRFFEFIDVDPYGSIVPFLDVALTHVKNNGYLGLTATDLSALTGSVPGKTLRRYGAFVKTDLLKHETGIRLLLAYVVQRAAAMDMAIQPVVSFWKSHYYRLVVKVKHGSGIADRALEKVRRISKDVEISSIYDHVVEGPIWTGPLLDAGTLDRILETRKQYFSEQTYRFIETIRHEDTRMYFYEMTDFARKLGRSLPQISRMLKLIGDEFKMPAYRTHFSPTGIKTTMNAEDFFALFDRNSVP